LNLDVTTKHIHVKNWAKHVQHLQYKNQGLWGLGTESSYGLHHETTIMLQKPRTSHGWNNNEPLQQENIKLENLSLIFQ